MKACAEVATQRTINWQRFCQKDENILPFIVQASISLDEAVSPVLLQLLQCALCGAKGLQQVQQQQQQASSGCATAAAAASPVKHKKEKEKEKSEGANLFCVSQHICVCILNWTSINATIFLSQKMKEINMMKISACH